MELVEENDMGLCSSTCTEVTEPRGDFVVGNFTGLGFPVEHTRTTAVHIYENMVKFCWIYLTVVFLSSNPPKDQYLPIGIPSYYSEFQ